MKYVIAVLILTQGLTATYIVNNKLKDWVWEDRQAVTTTMILATLAGAIWVIV